MPSIAFLHKGEQEVANIKKYLGEKNMSEKESLVIASKVKAYVKEKGCMMSSDALDSISDEIRKMIDRAVTRTKDNKRSTLKPYDL